MRSLFIIILVVTSSCSPIWVNKGPFGSDSFKINGCVSELIIDPSDSNNLYLGAENGGVWVMENYLNNTSTWKPLTDDAENLQIRGLAKSKGLPNYIVYGNGLGHVFHSFDSGKTWEQLVPDNFEYIHRIQASTRFVPKLEIGKRPKLVTQLSLFVCSKTGLHKLILEDGELVQKTVLHTGDVMDILRYDVSNNELIIGVRSVGVLSSVDGGANWTTSLVWDNSRNYLSEMIQLSSSNRYTVAKFGHVLFQNDNPITEPWREFSFTTDSLAGNNNGYRGNYSGKNNEWTNALAVNPQNKNHIYVGQIGLEYTLDGGSTWLKEGSSVSIGHEDIQEIVFGKRDELLLATDGGVFVFGKNGGRNRSLNQGLSVLQMYRAGKNGNTVVSNCDHNGLIGTTDVSIQNPIWEVAQPENNGYGKNSLENDFVYTDSKTPNRFFIYFNFLNLLTLEFPNESSNDLLHFSDQSINLFPYYRRRNTGRSTASFLAEGRLNNLNYATTTLAVDPDPNSTTILMSCSQNSPIGAPPYVIRRTLDGTAQPRGGPRNDCGDENKSTFCFTEPVTNFPIWEEIFLSLSSPIVSIEYAKHTTGKAYALTESGEVYSSVNTNSTNPNWNFLGALPLNAQEKARQIAVTSTDDQTIYAMSHDHVYKSLDGGQIWTKVGASTLPSVKLNFLIADPLSNKRLYVATDKGVYFSESSGVKWKQYGVRLPNAPVMQIILEKNILHAVTFGRGYWQVAARK